MIKRSDLRPLAIGVLGLFLGWGAIHVGGKVWYYARVVFAVEKILVHGEQHPRI